MNRISSLRLAAALLLAGQILYVLVTLLHAGGDANHHPSVFAEYASSDNWKAVHVGQFAAMAIMLVGLVALSLAFSADGARAAWAGRAGAVLGAVSLAAYAVLQAVDGIALKQAVDAWVAAAPEDQATRFATAESVRWLEWGVRSYHDLALGLALLLSALALARAKVMAWPVPLLMSLAGLSYLAQGWVLGMEGFSGTHTRVILLTYVLNVIWMPWLLAVAWRTKPSRSATGTSRAA